MRAARILGLALVLAAAATADEPRAPAPKPDPAAVEARFVDGSTMKMTLLEKEVVVATKYGRLTVPAAEVRRIEFGLRIPEATAKLIEASVVDLGGPDFKRR